MVVNRINRENILLGTSWLAAICQVLFDATIEYQVEGTLLSRQLGYVIVMSSNRKVILLLTILLFFGLWLLFRKREHHEKLYWDVSATVFSCELLLAFSPTDLVKQISDIELLSVIYFNPLAISFFLQGFLLLRCLSSSKRKGIVCNGIALSAFVLYFIIMSNQFILCHTSSHAIRISSSIICSLPAISILFVFPRQNTSNLSVQYENTSKLLRLNITFTFFEIMIVLCLCYLCVLFTFDPLPIPTHIEQIINGIVCIFLFIFPVFMRIIQNKTRKCIPNSPHELLLWKVSIVFILLSYLFLPLSMFRIECEYRLIYMEMVVFFPLAQWYSFFSISLLYSNVLCPKKKLIILFVFFIGAITSFVYVSSTGLLLCIGFIIQYLIGSVCFYLLRKKHIEKSLPISHGQTDCVLDNDGTENQEKQEQSVPYSNCG